jgi:PBP1b-binding outer membrane lipoprotein LpoB
MKNLIAITLFALVFMACSARSGVGVPGASSSVSGAGPSLATCTDSDNQLVKCALTCKDLEDIINVKIKVIDSFMNAPVTGASDASAAIRDVKATEAAAATTTINVQAVVILLADLEASLLPKLCACGSLSPDMQASLEAIYKEFASKSRLACTAPEETLAVNFYETSRARMFYTEPANRAVAIKLASFACGTPLDFCKAAPADQACTPDTKISAVFNAMSAEKIDPASLIAELFTLKANSNMCSCKDPFDQAALTAYFQKFFSASDLEIISNKICTIPDLAARSAKLKDFLLRYSKDPKVLDAIDVNFLPAVVCEYQTCKAASVAPAPKSATMFPYVDLNLARDITETGEVPANTEVELAK